MMSWKEHRNGKFLLRYYSSIFLDDTKKTKKNFSQDNQSLGQILNLGPPEYKERVITTTPQSLLKKAVLRSSSGNVFSPKTYLFYKLWHAILTEGNRRLLPYTN
jgi:hypothetical protein